MEKRIPFYILFAILFTCMASLLVLSAKVNSMREQKRIGREPHIILYR